MATDYFSDDLIYLPKSEPESNADDDSYESDSSSPDSRPSPPASIYKSCGKLIWNPVDTIELIKSLSSECQELWDGKHPAYRDRVAKTAKQEFLANKFSTTPEEISRKIHNLRTQFNSEIRKIKKRRAKFPGEKDSTTRWEYFDSLMFLQPDALAQDAPEPEEPDSMDPLSYTLPVQTTGQGETVNLALAQFQADEEVTFGRAAADQAATSATTSSATATDAAEPKKRKLEPPPSKMTHAIAALARLVNYHPLPAPDVDPPLTEPVRDDNQVFGDFVATELRNLRSHNARLQLRRVILKGILEAGRDEDIMRMGVQTDF